MAAPQKSIIIFLSSCRPGRMAERMGKFLKAKVEAGGMKAELFDPLTMKFEVLTTPFHYMAKPEDAPAWMREANTKLQNADGYIIATAEYNSSIPPALTNMLDYFSPATYRHHPVAVVSYSVGGWGGIRAQTLLPTLYTELGMVGIPSRVSISSVGNVIGEDGKCKDSKIDTSVAALVKELGWYADAIKAQKKVSPLS